MSLRAKILAYLVLIHVILGGISVYALRDRPVVLLIAEVLFVASAVIGYLLVRAFFVPLELIRTGAEERISNFPDGVSKPGSPSPRCCGEIRWHTVQETPSRAS